MFNPVRLWLKKEGAARFISHLDFSRCIARAMRKARLPVWYTEGFNPHPYSTFLLPLSLGVVGLREAVDIRLVEELPLEKVKTRLNDCLPQGIGVTEVTRPVQKAGEIGFASYEIRIQAENEGGRLYALQKALEASALPVIKKGKSKRQTEVDIKPHLHHPVLRDGDGDILLSVTLPAGNAFSINHTLVLEALGNAAGCVFTAEFVTRTDVFDVHMARFY